MKRSWLFTLSVLAIALFVGGCGCAAPAPTQAPKKSEAQTYLNMARKAGASNYDCSAIRVYSANPASSSIVFGSLLNPELCGGDGVLTITTVVNGKVVEQVTQVEGWTPDPAFTARMKTLPKRWLHIVPTAGWKVRSVKWMP